MHLVFQNDLDWIQINNTDVTNYTLPFKPDQKYYNYRFGLSVESKMSLNAHDRHRRSDNIVTVSSGIKWKQCTHKAGKGNLIQFSVIPISRSSSLSFFGVVTSHFQVQKLVVLQ